MSWVIELWKLKFEIKYSSKKYLLFTDRCLLQFDSYYVTFSMYKFVYRSLFVFLGRWSPFHLIHIFYTFIINFTTTKTWRLKDLRFENFQYWHKYGYFIKRKRITKEILNTLCRWHFDLRRGKCMKTSIKFNWKYGITFKQKKIYFLQINVSYTCSKFFQNQFQHTLIS